MPAGDPNDPPLQAIYPAFRPTALQYEPPEPSSLPSRWTAVSFTPAPRPTKRLLTRYHQLIDVIHGFRTHPAIWIFPALMVLLIAFVAAIDLPHSSSPQSQPMDPQPRLLAQPSPAVPPSSTPLVKPSPKPPQPLPPFTTTLTRPSPPPDTPFYTEPRDPTPIEKMLGPDFYAPNVSDTPPARRRGVPPLPRLFAKHLSRPELSLINDQVLSKLLREDPLSSHALLLPKSNTSSISLTIHRSFPDRCFLYSFWYKFDRVFGSSETFSWCFRPG